ncbi:hypothetical protein I4U23_018542 [Adineta vaga]|nr:hypothetical protein I4U23_018542 [Adineta vaga]
MNKTAYVYVNEHSVSPSLICPICLDILQEPHTHIRCDSAFCRSCLLQLAEPFCPICRWTWNESIPLQYNIHLPKTNRLIRNMLDDLLVRCTHCHTIRRRGQFEHECQMNLVSMSSVGNLRMISQERLRTIRMILSSFILFLFLILFYYYRNYIFESAIDRHDDFKQKTGYNIDNILLEKFYYSILKIIEYPVTILIVNICLWFNIMWFGDRLTSKTNSRILKNFFEILIIVNLIIYSIYH